jgi:DNA-binding LacI/PurR family transcriptional regulator
MLRIRWAGSSWSTLVSSRVSARLQHQSRSKRITSYDVARLAGVSQSTVSRAFGPEGVITPEARRRVLKVADELGWRPNSIASSLQRRSAHFIGLITAELSSPWRSQQLAALVPALEESGHRPLVFQTHSEEDIDSLIGEVLSYQSRAIVVGAGLMSSRIARICAREGLLVIVLNRWIESPGVVSIACDHRAGAAMAVDYLAGRGCRRIAYLQGSQGHYASHERGVGFIARARHHGLDAKILPCGVFDREAGRAAGRRIAEMDPAERPDGIFAGNDAMALGILDHAYATGAFSVPRDFALIGFDDIAEAAAPAYQLTTIHQPLEELTARVVRLLEQASVGGSQGLGKTQSEKLAPRLVERRSALWSPPSPEGGKSRAGRAAAPTRPGGLP